MTRSFSLLVFVLLFALAPSLAAAAPGKKVILKDLDAKSAESVKLEGKGTTEFDLSRKVHVFGQYATIVRPYPGMKGVFVEIYGWAEYISPNKKNWVYVDFHTASNRFQGIDNPSAEEIQAAIDQHARSFYRRVANKIVGKVKVSLAKEPNWLWEHPWKVSFRVVLNYERAASDTELESVEETAKVELFRAPNETKGPWTGVLRKKTELSLQEAQKIMMERLPDPRDPVVKSKRSLPAEELAALPRLNASAEFQASK